MDRPSSHSQRVPYARKEGRKSLFSKMKDSMRDMLSPSWLTDLVHNVKKESPSDDKNVVKSSDPSTGMQPGQSSMSSDNSPSQTPVLPAGQAGMMGSSSQQAGINRDMQFKNRGTFVGNGQPRTLDFAAVGQSINPSGVLASPFQQGTFPPPISEFTSAQLPLARITEKSDSIMAQEDTMSQRSDGSKSTSGCSSMVPQPDVPQRLDTAGDKRKAPEQMTLGGTSPQEQQVAKRQRLHAGAGSNQTFNRRLSDTFISKQPTPAVTNRPAFNTSLFGSPLNNESSLLGTSVHESSFYPGKTKFGGRSSISFRSQRKNMDLNQSLPSRLSVPVKAFMKARPRLTPSKEAVTSSTAKRILEALDKMPTPLNDAKKIPMVPRQWTESPSFFSRDTNRSMTRTGPPTQKLNISSQASISKNRQVSFAPLQQSKATSSQIQEDISRRPTRQDTVILNNEVSVPSGKMKRDKSYHRGSASVKTTLEEDDTVIIPNLNTEFTLPVSSMPQFNFATPASQSNQDKAVKRSADSPVKHSLNFTFSSPIIEPVPANKPASPQKYAGFQFSSPISVEKNNGNSEPAMLGKPFVATSTSFGSSSTPAFTFSSPATKTNMDISFSTAPKPKPKVNGPVETSVGGIKVAAELKQGSVMDILGGSKSVTSLSSTQSTSAPPLSEIFKKTGWSCEVCLINNKDADSKCVACQTPKPGGQKPKGDTSSAPPLSEIFKKTGWSCNVCLINNKDADSKCVACQTPKPGGQKPKGDSQSSAPPLSEIFKKTGWSCDVCLINNKDADSKCVACQTPKPGGQKPKDVFSVQKSDPSEPLKSDLFAKFKQPAGSWTCDTCLIQNKQDDIKCVACQTRKPGSATSNTSPLVSSIQPGNWICNVCLIQNKKDDTICGACKAAKSTSKPSELNKSDSLFAKFKPAAGSWECEVCLVQNKSDDNKCVACQTPKPLKFFKHPPGDWVCDTCLVNNKASAVNCVACNYVRPGPPRTQAVPSIAKSYTVSQASGFNLPSTESGGITISSTGGFKFTVPTSASSTASGFDVSKINTNTNKSADSKLSGGFKFNSDMKSETSTSSGFKFGSQTSSESDKPSVNSGGFKINALPPSGDKPTSGFQFGNKDMKPENKDGPLKSAGFQIGKLDSTISSKIPSSSSEQVTNVGFVFGQKADAMSTKGDTMTTTSVPGGFSFKSSDSNSSSVTTNATETVTNTSKGIGGFNFTSLTSNSVAATTSSSSIGNFAFTATKVTDPSALSGTSNPLDNTKPSVGGFTFSQKPVDSNTSSSPFTFAQNSTSVASPTKRGRDDDTGEPAMKKSFGQPAVTTSSTPFQLGANSATTTTSNSSSPFVFGQTTATTLANAGPFAFGQQNSTPSTAVQPVFGLQNSTPASSALPSVFGQQNSTVTSTSSTSSTFVFGGQNATPVVSSSTSLPVFGQTNSMAATTTAPTSTPSLFQFGQKNQAPASTPFNFATQSSGQTSVFGNSNYNFTAQKTESSTSGSASGLFKFGGAPSQPAPATTPAFGSGSAFGSSSTPAFGSGSGTVVAFSGNAPSTTPAFGATPPAFGSSNSSTGQAAPAFGGNVPCLYAPVVSTCLSTTLNSSFLSTSCSSAVISSYLKCSTSTVSLCSNVVKFSTSRSCKESSYASAESSAGSSAVTTNGVYPKCKELKLSKLTSLATDTHLRDSKENSFFDGCFDFVAKNVKEEIIDNAVPVPNAASNREAVAPKCTSSEVSTKKARCEDGSYSLIKTDMLVDEVCQTDGTVVVEFKKQDTEKGQKNIGLKSVPPYTRNNLSKEVQTEFVENKKKNSIASISISKSLQNKEIEATLSDTKEQNTLKHTSSESKKSDIKSIILAIPRTGAANEPLSCGKLFIVPCYIDSLDNSTRLATAITQPLMTSRLSVSPSIGLVNSNHMFLPPFNTSQKDRTVMSSSFKYSKKGHTKSRSSPLVPPLFSNLNVPTFDIYPGSSASLPSNSSPILGNMNRPISSVTQSIFGNLNLQSSSANSSMFSHAYFPISSTPIFGNANLPSSSRARSLSCNLSLPSSSLFSPIFYNLNLPNNSENSHSVNSVSLPNSQDKPVLFGSENSPAFCNVSVRSRSVNLKFPVDSAISTKSKKGIMDNKSGFILNIPFGQGAPLQKTLASHSRPEIVSSSEAASTFASGVFVFGGHAKPNNKPFSPIVCKQNTFLADTTMCGMKPHGSSVRDNAGCSTDSMFVFGRSSKSDKPTFLSKKSVFVNRLSDNVVMQSNYSNVTGRSTNINEETGVFSFQGPAVLNDVVMEDASCSSGPENTSREDGASRKVHFSLSRPTVPKFELSNKDPLNDNNNGGKSILKTKINELRSAFHTATIAGKEPNNSSLGDVDKLPSDSCILGERSLEAKTSVCNSKSMPFTSDFMMKEEGGERRMDTSVATKHDHKPETPFIENSQLGEIFLHASTGNTDQNFMQTQDSVKTSVDTQRSPPCREKKTVNFGPGQSDSSFSSNVFTFAAKATAGPSGRKSPLFNFERSPIKFENCFKSDQSTATPTCLTKFSPVSPNVFVFSSVLPPCQKSVDVPPVKLKKRSKHKSLNVSAFSGKSVEKNTSYEVNEPSPTSSKQSKSSESTQSVSGSDVSSNSSACSSDSGHSVSSSSSSSSGSSDDSDDDCKESYSQPMEDDAAHNNENRSWNALPFEEDGADFITNKDKIRLLDFLVNNNAFNINQSVTDLESAELECTEIDRWCGLKETVTDYFMLCPHLLSGVFGNTSQPAAPAQSSSVFQFGAKPAESTPAAPSAGFNFSASANPAGLGAGAASFNFSAQAPAVNAFSATGPSTPSDRKIKKAVRKIRR